MTRLTLVALCLVMTTAAAAQTPEPPATSQGAARPATYGTKDLTALTLGAYAFVGTDLDAPAQGTGAGYRYEVGAIFGGGSLAAAARLPNGAEIVAISLSACDTHPTSSVGASLRVNDMTAGGSSTAVSVQSTSGCGLFEAILPSPVIVDNARFVYVVFVGMASTDDRTRFNAVTLYYRLKVSPAPAAATFNDVPVGHPLRPFVEALVSSGITAGCGGGNFCPDAPLTRGQMAVFLSVALGLHWPN